MRTLQEIQPGQTLGRYEFLVPIAEGGMASVWAARLKGSRGFSKTVAVKTMLPSVSDDPQFEQMFLDEAQIASRIRHPNVAEILDLGEEEEVLYLVMEWVDGEPLANVRRAAAKQGGIPRGIAMRMVADAAAGLHGAHEIRDENGQPVGLVHRDISPQNILVTFDGMVKIVDFGVAKAAGRTSGQTTAGQVKGKPPYMSPEQALGEAVDRRTDVFALGIILYQLTTGKHPFRGESDLVTLQNIVSDKSIVPPRAYDKQYPRSLELVVTKALDRRREARFQTCAELEAALEEVFGKEVARTRSEDTGKFMKALFGGRGEERRRALAEAVRVADERAAGRASLSDLSEAAFAVQSAARTPTTGTAASMRLRGTDPRGIPVTPFAATFTTPVRTKGRGAFVALALAVAVVAGAAFGLRPAIHASAANALGARSPSRPTPSAPAAVTPPEIVPPETAATVAEPAPSEQASAAPVEDPSVLAKRKHAVWRPPAHAIPSLAKSTIADRNVPSKSVVKSGFSPPPISDPGF
jgi:serine/threonine-protein kinase